jgi:hypothetical protein
MFDIEGARDVEVIAPALRHLFTTAACAGWPIRAQQVDVLR